MDIQKLENKKKACVISLLKLYKRANAGHIGSSLSCLDILLYFFSEVLGEDDRFVLSKGHAAAALYIVLANSGRIEPELLDSFYADGTLLAAHPPCNRMIKDIPFGTGSLGHGISLAAGMAFARNFQASARKVFCVISEGDLNEGSSWEAMLFAAHHKLDNLTIIVDRNGLQAFGISEQVIALDDLAAKFRAFNFAVVIAENGNEYACLHEAYGKIKKTKGRPKCIIAKTTKGSGISFMENKFEWHYLPMTDEHFKTALSELET